jgi:3-oxoacyl-ACP reductase-like protein
MPQTKKDLSPEDAKKEAAAALDKSDTTKVTVQDQGDGTKWTVTSEP